MAQLRTSHPLDRKHFLFELKGWRIVADVRTHWCDDDLETELIAIGADQMGAQFDRTVGEFVVRQKVVYVKNAIDTREIVCAHVNRSYVRYLILDASDEHADLQRKWIRLRSTRRRTDDELYLESLLRF